MTTEASHASGRQYLVHLVPMQGPSAHEDDGWPDWPTDARGVIVCATDLTELRRAEMQRQELLGFIAHDIRSPQASLLALVELQQMGHGPSPDEALQHIESLARGTLDLCEELLQVMRAENRPVSLKTTDLHSLADECIDEVSLRAQLKHVTLAREWDGEIRHPALVDDYLVHRALVNLLGNAVKFSPEHSEVTVSVSTRDGHHIIAVTDQGPGIPQSELGRLFRRYERLEQGRASHLPPGIGLGLVFIDTVARRHGGASPSTASPARAPASSSGCQTPPTAPAPPCEGQRPHGKSDVGVCEAVSRVSAPAPAPTRQSCANADRARSPSAWPVPADVRRTARAGSAPGPCAA